MQDKDIIRLSKNEGFCAKILDTADITFDFSFRKYCEQNLCGNYGTNPLCPPFCGEGEEMKERVLEHKTALVLMSEHSIINFSDTEKIKKAQRKHNEATLRLLEKMEKKPRQVALCSPDDTKLPPHICAHCLSAYCINVKDMAEKCGMSYDFKDCKLPLFGFITID